MKTVQVIAAVVAVLLTTSTSNAGSRIKMEKPCGSKCTAPQPTNPNGIPGMTFRRTGEGNIGTPDYVSRSQTVIRSTYGTSVINSTYRSYSR